MLDPCPDYCRHTPLLRLRRRYHRAANRVLYQVGDVVVLVVPVVVCHPPQHFILRAAAILVRLLREFKCCCLSWLVSIFITL